MAKKEAIIVSAEGGVYSDMYAKRGRGALIIPALLILSLLVSACAAERRPGDRSPEEDIRQQGTQATRAPGQSSADEEKPGRKTEEEVKKPAVPQAIAAGENEEPRLKVYIVQENEVREMPFEEYVAGVVAGEIKNDWPIEAIKAQAIIARTFVLQFIEEKGQSKYENAHVSTDIEEAQAWNAQAVNDRIKEAVNETRGQVIVYEGEFVRTWFHSNAGGKTATPKEGLNYKDEAPPYIQVVDSPDTNEAVEADAKNWTASFPKSKVLTALKEAGKPLKDFSTISIGLKGPSGRAVTIKLDDTEVSAAELRLALGTTDMRSTLIDKIALEGGNVVMTGRGYGHGVGMSQWGAFNMAKNKKTAKEIIAHYFKDVDIVTMWE
jgi:stage II sporulation protein D